MLLDIVAKSLYSEKEVRTSSHINVDLQICICTYFMMQLGFYQRINFKCQ